MFFGKTSTQNNKPDQKYLCLLDLIGQFNIFEKIPKNFTISTNNHSCKFNSEILKHSSRIISQYLVNKPKNFEYHINISDEANILGKFEQLYQGNPVTFKKIELSSNNPISDLFEIRLQATFGKSFFEFSMIGIEFNFITLVNTFKDTTSFTIKTNKGDYNCNYIGVFSSKVISEYIQANPTATSYTYEFDDENSEFQTICDFFNFKKVPLSTNNALTIKKISEDLNIMLIPSLINDFLDDYYSFSQKFDDEQETIDKVEDLFDLLYNIESKTVQTVKNTIILSEWSKTEESVLELASFIIQVINSGLHLHGYLADLIYELDFDSNDDNKLKILRPFIVKNMLDSFGKNLQNCSFVFNLLKKGIILREDLIRRLKHDIYFGKVQIDSDNNEDQKGNYKLILQVNNNVLLWFLPEIIETMNIRNKEVFQGNKTHIYSFIEFYFDKIDLYKKLRDQGEPSDEITLAIRHDDIDKLSSILSDVNLEASKIVIPFNIYEEFIPDCQCNLINYSAAYGSTKCFKYLLLNHHQLDENSFKLAVYGGNTEIIKIVDQKNIPISVNQQNSKVSGKTKTFDNIDPIKIAIMKHQYNLFDWILEKKLAKSDFNNSMFFDLISFSAQNGNAHSLVELLTKCFEYTKKFFDKNGLTDQSIYEKTIETLCNNGFYHTVKLLIDVFKVIQEKYQQETLEITCDCLKSNQSYKNSTDPFGLYKKFGWIGSIRIYRKYAISYGNLSIFKLFVDSSNQSELDYLLLNSITRNYVSIVKYYFENLVKKNIFQIGKETIGNILLYSLGDKTHYLFDYIMNQIKNTNPDILEGFYWSIPMLSKACETQNIKAVKYITDLILEEKTDEDFTIPFYEAAGSKSIEICNFFIDKKVVISFKEISSIPINAASMNEEIFSIIKKKTLPNDLKLICERLFSSAIHRDNKQLVECMIKEKIYIKSGLIDALNQNKLEIAQIIVKYGNSEMINENLNDQTALTIAVEINNEKIVELLLNNECFDKELSLFNYAFYISKDKITDLLLNSKYFDINDTMYTERNIPEDKTKNNDITNKRIYSCNINDTLLIYSVSDSNEKMIDLIINHPAFDKKKSKLNQAIFISIQNNNFKIYQKLIKLVDNDLYDYTYSGSTIFGSIDKINPIRPLSNAALKSGIINKIGLNRPFGNAALKSGIINNMEPSVKQKYFSEIFNNPSIELDRNSLNEAFSFIFMDDAIKTKKDKFKSPNLIKLLEYDKKHNNCIDINKSMSFLYSKLTEINLKAFDFLLEKGFNPNIPDHHGVYLLQYALFLDAYNFIHYLLQTNKVDVNIKVPSIPYESYLLNSTFDTNIKFEWQKIKSSKIVVKSRTSYLHLAAKSSNVQILKEFIDRKLIDVNVEDDLGNTPLIDACISKRKENIKLLFKSSNLDYKHCNKEGYDALKIINPSFKEDDKIVQDKQQYLKELMNYCIQNNNNNNNSKFI